MISGAKDKIEARKMDIETMLMDFRNELYNHFPEVPRKPDDVQGVVTDYDKIEPDHPSLKEMREIGATLTPKLIFHFNMGRNLLFYNRGDKFRVTYWNRKGQEVLVFEH